MARNLEVKARFTTTSDTSGVDRAQTRLQRLRNFIATRLVVTFGDLQRAAVAAFNAIKQAGTLEGQTAALERQLAAQGVAFDEYLAKLDEVAAGTISRSNLINSASKALLLNIPINRITDLLELARASAIATGQSTQQAFDDIVTGIGRASPLILDNLGIVVKLGEAYEQMAARVGKSTEELTAHEKSQALLENVLENNAARIEQFGNAASKTADELARATATIDNLRQSAASAITVLALVVSDIGLKVAQAAALATEAVTKILGTLAALGTQIPFVGERFDGLSRSIRQFDDDIDAFQESVIQKSRDIQAAGEATLNSLLGIRDGIDSVNQAAEGPAITSYAEELRKIRENTNGLGEEMEDVAAALQSQEDGFGEAAREAVQYASSLDRARSSAVALASVAGGGALVGPNSGLVARDPRSQAAVNQGGRVVLGGTRINLPGGGSRLLVPPSGSRSGV